MAANKTAAPKPPSLKQQAYLIGITTSLQITGMMLAGRDPDDAGIDDYIARKLAELTTDIQVYQMTGKLPGQE